MAGSSGASATSASAASAVPAVGAPLPEDALTAAKDKHKELSRARRKRAVLAGTASSEGVSSLSLASHFTPHSASTPGITALALPPIATREVDAQIAVTGGNDGAVLAMDTHAGRVVARCGSAAAPAHSKRVTGVCVNAGRDAWVSASADGTVAVWAPNTSEAPVIPSALASGSSGAPAYTCSPSYAAALVLRPHAGHAVTSLSAHPIGDWIATTGRDGTACLIDTAAGRTLAVCGGVAPSPSGQAVSFTTGALHPDGILVTAGCSDGVVRLWDARENTLAADLGAASGSDGHAPGTAIRSLSFSENGYLLASGGGDGLVKLWDLRKPEAAMRTMNSGVEGDASPVTALSFDWSGQYLAAGSGEGGLCVWGTKEWNALWAAAKGTTNGAGDAVTGLQWGALVRRLYAVSLDRHLRVFAH